jgi:uncharacterized protein (TIGR03083 family)
MPVAERAVDCGDLYRAKRRELMEFAQSLSERQLAVMVPATPAWTVHSVICHLVGLTSDMNGGNLSIGDPAVWTAHQVESRRKASVRDLDTEWEREGPAFEEGLRLFGYEVGSHFVGDLLQHVADIRHALGLSAPDDDEVLSVALDFYLMSFNDTLVEAKIGVRVESDDETWILGSGEESAGVKGPRYELFRGLGGRRTETQIRSLTWSGDVQRVISVFSRYPMPNQAIVEQTSHQARQRRDHP